MSGLTRQRWTKLWQSAEAPFDPLVWFKKLEVAYSEAPRYYHNARHITECLREFDAASHLAREAAAVELAIWFHDVVYDPKALNNEERSAMLAEQCLKEAGLESRFCQTVVQLILATKHHDVTLGPDAPVMVDVDLSILGQPERRFTEYERQIRLEYAWVPEPTFRATRAEILQAFLARKRIYTTDWFYGKYEQVARQNIQMSLRNF